MPSIEVDDATMEKLRNGADRRGITVEMMTKVFVQFAIDEANTQVAARSTVERPDPSPEFVARAMEHRRKLIADLHELERAGWPPGTR